MPTESKHAGKGESHTDPALRWAKPPMSNCGCLGILNFLFFFLYLFLRCLDRSYLCVSISKALYVRERRGKRKSQYKTKSNSRWIFFSLRLKTVYCSSCPPLLQLYDVIKVPFPPHYFQMIQTLGILRMFACNEI